MSKIQLTKEQYNYLKKETIEKFPTNSIKIIRKNNKKYLIINLNKFYNTNSITNIDFLNILIDYEKLKWKFLGSLYPYIYFYKNETWFNKIKNKWR